MSWSVEESDDFPDESGEIREILDRGICDTIHLFLDFPEYGEVLAKEATGIANREGGVIVLGVQRDGTPSGLANPEEKYQKVIESLEEYIEPDLNYDLRLKSIDGKNIIIVKIERYTENQFNTIHAMDYVFYRRGFQSSKPLSPAEVVNILREDI